MEQSFEITFVAKATSLKPGKIKITVKLYPHYNSQLK